MKEHALPQDVTGYRFHIIGNMTLKQFAEVAGGCVVGFLIYTTNLPVVIKWPLILVAAAIGAMLAFVPYEERPLDHWFTAFFRALYRPTQFFWKRSSKIPEPFLYQQKTDLKTLVKEVDLTPARRARVKEYLRTIDEPVAAPDEIEDYSQQRLSEVLGVFEQGTNPSQVYAIDDRATLPPTTFVASLDESDVENHVTIDPTAVAAQVSRQLGNTPTSVQFISPSQQATTVTAANTPIAHIISASIPTTNVPATATTQPSTDSISTTHAPVSIPQVGSIQLDYAHAEAVTTGAVANASSVTSYATDPNMAYLDPTNVQLQTAALPTQSIVQNAHLPFPDRPQEPNKVVGMVVNAQNTPIQDAIVEITTPEGLPARAVKTNMLGQFFVTTPLGNGTYTLNVEKDGLSFPVQQLIINDQILDPIEVRST